MPTALAPAPARGRHPSEAAYCGGCRCPACTGARYRSAKRYRARVAATGPALVGAARAAGHLRGLLALGYTPAALSAAAGLDGAHIARLAAGRIDSVGRGTLAAVLALSPASIAAAAPAHTRLPAAAAARRLRALQALGWPLAALAGPGRSIQTLAKITARPGGTVTAAVYRAVAALYDELAMTPGPSPRTRTIAARRGWQPPLAWDDDALDHPAAQPSRPAENAGRDRADRNQAIAGLTAHGHPAPAIAAALGCTTRTVERARAANRASRPQAQSSRPAVSSPVCRAG